MDECSNFCNDKNHTFHFLLDKVMLSDGVLYGCNLWLFFLDHTQCDIFSNFCNSWIFCSWFFADFLLLPSRNHSLHNTSSFFAHIITRVYSARNITDKVAKEIRVAWPYIKDYFCGFSMLLGVCGFLLLSVLVCVCVCVCVLVSNNLCW